MAAKEAAIGAAVAGSLVAAGACAVYYSNQSIVVDLNPFQLSEAKESESDKFGFKFEHCARTLCPNTVPEHCFRE